MKKNFVLDTNVLLHDPRAMFHFTDNTVVIPIYVLEEIDHFKKELSERGRNAREVVRRLDEFRDSGAHLSEGVKLEKGGLLKVALAVRDKDPQTKTVLVTKDVNLRIRADALGLNAEDFNAEKIDIEELYSG